MLQGMRYDFVTENQTEHQCRILLLVKKMGAELMHPFASNSPGQCALAYCKSDRKVSASDCNDGLGL